MKKLMILVMAIALTVSLSAEMYTGVPDFLPYGVDVIGEPKAPGWIQQKSDPNGFQGAFHYDANGNKHTGRANPYLNIFYEDGPETGLDKTGEADIELMLKWIIKKMCITYGFKAPWL